MPRTEKFSQAFGPVETAAFKAFLSTKGWKVSAMDDDGHYNVIRTDGLPSDSSVDSHVFEDGTFHVRFYVNGKQNSTFRIESYDDANGRVTFSTIQ